MGTTQRIGSGVKNEPNWRGLNSAVTGIAKAIEEKEKLEQEEKNNPPKNEEEIETLKQKLYKLDYRRENNAKKSFERLVKVGGGSKNISSGKSNKFGRAGLKSSSNLISFFTSVAFNGLDKTLIDKGFGSIVGKSLKEVLDFITEYTCESNIGMDEAAAKVAMLEVLKIIESEINNDINSLEKLMKEYVDSEKLSNLLCTFFGKYIYEFLFERLDDRLSQMKGTSISKSTFESIKLEINGRVDLLNSERTISKINWSGQEGKAEIEKIFEAIIKIEGE